MLTKATIIVKGDVQEAGYRGLVFETARKLKLTGYVENLEDGRVRIICEGKKKAIEELCKKIRIKDDFVAVESIRKRFGKFTGEFKKFVVRTENLAFEMFQGYATAGKYFRNLGEKVNGVGKSVDSMHESMDQKLDKMDDSYGELARKMDSMDSHLREIRDDFKVLVEIRDDFKTLVKIRDDFKLLVNHVVKGDREIFRS